MKPLKWTNSFTDLPGSIQGVAPRCNQTFLELQLDRAARENMVRGRRSRAWVYPLFTFSITFLVMAFLAPVILNPFMVMYDEFGLILPTPTRLLISISENIFGEPLRLIAYGFVAAAVGFGLLRLVNRYSLMSRYCNTFLAGRSDSVSAMASFTGLLAHLLGTGMPLPDAIEKSGKDCGHRYLSDVGHQLARHLRDEKGPLSIANDASSLPRNVVEALQPKGSAAPNLELLRELSGIYDERVTARTELASSAIGVFGMLIVGALVLFVVIALFMPIISLVTGLS